VFRIYYPLFTRQSQPGDHPVFHPQGLHEKKLEAFLHLQAMKFPIQCVPEAPVLRAARAAVCGELAKYSEQTPLLRTRVATL
jgi:hypothetical protein